MTMDDRDMSAPKIAYERLQEGAYRDSLRLQLTTIADDLAYFCERDLQDDMSQYLNRCNGMLRRCRKALPEEDNCLYDIGRLEGILDSFGLLYEHRMEQARTDAEIEHQLSGSRGTTMRILQVLYENRGEDKDLPHEQLAAAVGTSKQSLTNIMRRLEPTLIIRARSTTTHKYYDLTDAGIRYYEKKKQQKESQAVQSQSAEFSDMFARLEKQIGEVKTFREKNIKLTADVKFYKKNSEKKEKELQAAQDKLDELQTNYQKLQIDYGELQGDYNELQIDYNKVKHQLWSRQTAKKQVNPQIYSAQVQLQFSPDQTHAARVRNIKTAGILSKDGKYSLLSVPGGKAKKRFWSESNGNDNSPGMNRRTKVFAVSNQKEEKQVLFALNE